MIVADFADFCLVVYMLVDDYYRLLPACVKPRSSSDVCSDSELLTMALVGECMGWDEERAAMSRWHEHRDLFPHIPHRTRFNRRRRALTDALLLLRQQLLTDLDYALDRQWVIDSLPLPVIGFHLVPGAASAGAWRAAGADYGKVVTKKQTIFGYKLHLLVTLNGVIRDFVLAPASVNDHRVAPELLAAVADGVVLGDKGYIDAALVEALREEQGVTLATPLRRNQREQRDPAFVRLLNGFRQVIATVNDQLEGQFGIGRNHAHTFAGLCARLASKLTAHTLCMYINRLMGKADALQIKALAFPN
jgi:IS5 family transposase